MYPGLQILLFACLLFWTVNILYENYQVCGLTLFSDGIFPCDPHMQCRLTMLFTVLLT